MEERIISIIMSDRVVNKDFQKQIDNNTVHICSRHFTEEHFYVCKHPS